MIYFCIVFNILLKWNFSTRGKFANKSFYFLLCFFLLHLKNRERTFNNFIREERYLFCFFLIFCSSFWSHIKKKSVAKILEKFEMLAIGCVTSHKTSNIKDIYNECLMKWKYVLDVFFWQRYIFGKRLIRNARGLRIRFGSFLF